MDTAPYLIEPLLLPPAIDSPDAVEFLEFVELTDALVLETWGNPDRSSPAKARLQYWRDNPYTQVRLFFVRVDGRMVARSWIRFGLQENVHTALLHVSVLAEFGGRGIGQALLGLAEELAASLGMNLPAGEGTLDALEDEARLKADEYELLHWTDTCPEEYADQLAVLMSRMSTDAPSGALSYDAESWDVTRVRHVETTWTPAGLHSLVASARHRKTGELAAYSVLQVSAGKPWLASQHRGHRLGMLVKILNIRRLLSGYPAVQRIITFNAAENDHMLSINVALGFRPTGYDGAWQKAP